MRKYIKLIMLMMMIVAFSIGGLLLLKQVGIEQGYPTRIIPFISMLLSTLIFLFAIDHKKLTDMALFWSRSVIPPSLWMAVMAMIPIFLGVLLQKKFVLTDSITPDFIGITGYYLLVALSEEVLCRGYLYHLFDKSLLQILVPSVAFGSIHIISPEFNLLLFLLLVVNGCLYAILFRTIGNLWPMILFHAVWDIGSSYTDYYSNPIIDILWMLCLVLIMRSIFRKTAKA